MPEIIIVEGLTNQEFFERHAAPGRVGLTGGPELINRLISRAQRHLNDAHDWSRWSHAFLFQGRRHDGHHWVIESDLDIKTKHIRLGVQENRMTKYHDDASNASVAVLDFGLTSEQEKLVLSAALELVSVGTRYSLREIAGTVWAMRHPRWQPRENLLAREKAFYCSAFVRHVFGKAGIDLVAGDCGKKHRTGTHRNDLGAAYEVDYDARRSAGQPSPPPRTAREVKTERSKLDNPGAAATSLRWGADYGGAAMAPEESSAGGIQSAELGSAERSSIRER